MQVVLCHCSFSVSVVGHASARHKNLSTGDPLGRLPFFFLSCFLGAVDAGCGAFFGENKKHRAVPQTDGSARHGGCRSHERF